jgi:hypothetical protein
MGQTAGMGQTILARDAESLQPPTSEPDLPSDPMDRPMLTGVIATIIDAPEVLETT